jgi:universal stress protein A
VLFRTVLYRRLQSKHPEIGRLRQCGAWRTRCKYVVTAPTTLDMKETAMKAKTILCPIDFSAGSLAAMEEARSMAEDHGGHLIIAHVIKPSDSDDLCVSPRFDVTYRQEMVACLKSVAAPIKGATVEYRVVFGDPAATVVRIAHEDAVDLIVMGTHGRSGLSRLLLGSVAESVVRTAPCPVLTIREGQAAHDFLNAAAG